jgi:hypothetical protein
MEFPGEMLSPAIGYLRLKDREPEALAKALVDRVRSRDKVPRPVGSMAGEVFRMIVPRLVQTPRTPKGFVGRDADLARLDELASRTDQLMVVHGLGGVGKSTLAKAYARKHAEKYGLVWWVTADPLASLETGLAELATAVGTMPQGSSLKQRVEAGIR